jgi:hypothetical protein
VDRCHQECTDVCAGGSAGASFLNCAQDEASGQFTWEVILKLPSGERINHYPLGTKVPWLGHWTVGPWRSCPAEGEGIG